MANLRPGGRFSLSNTLDVPLKNILESRLPSSGRYKVVVIYHNACIKQVTSGPKSFHTVGNIQYGLLNRVGY